MYLDSFVYMHISCLVPHPHDMTLSCWWLLTFLLRCWKWIEKLVFCLYTQCLEIMKIVSCLKFQAKIIILLRLGLWIMNERETLNWIYFNNYTIYVHSKQTLIYLLKGSSWSISIWFLREGFVNYTLNALSTPDIEDFYRKVSRNCKILYTQFRNSCFFYLHKMGTNPIKSNIIVMWCI